MIHYPPQQNGTEPAWADQHNRRQLRDDVALEAPTEVRQEARRYAEESVAELKAAVFARHGLAA